MDIGSLFVLLLATLVTAALATAALFGMMFLIHTFAADKIPDTGYEHFDFNSITKPTLSEFLVRLAAIVFPPTVLLPILTNILFPPLTPHGFRKHYFLLSFLLFILETVAVAIGLFKILKIDRIRIIILTSAVAIAYLLLYWLFIYNDLYS